MFVYPVCSAVVYLHNTHNIYVIHMIDCEGCPRHPLEMFVYPVCSAALQNTHNKYSRHMMSAQRSRSAMKIAKLLRLRWRSMKTWTAVTVQKDVNTVCGLPIDCWPPSWYWTKTTRPNMYSGSGPKCSSQVLDTACCFPRNIGLFYSYNKCYPWRRRIFIPIVFRRNPVEVHRVAFA